jgi:hypothetical protein
MLRTECAAKQMYEKKPGDVKNEEKAKGLCSGTMGHEKS